MRLNKQSPAIQRRDGIPPYDPFPRYSDIGEQTRLLGVTLADGVRSVRQYPNFLEPRGARTDHGIILLDREETKDRSHAAPGRRGSSAIRRSPERDAVGE